MRSPGAKSQARYGWWVVSACAIVQLYASGTFFYGFSALFNPIVEEFGWSYALVSLAVSLRGFESGVFAPVVGIFVDRFGSRKLLFGGVVIMGLSFLLLSRVQGLGSFYVVFVLLAVGFSLASPVVTMTAVARWFGHRGSLAMGFLSTGFGGGGLLMPAVVWLVDGWGWRQAVIVFGIGTWLLGIPLALTVKAPRREVSSAAQDTPGEMRQTSDGLRPREVLKRKDFWLLSTAVLFAGLAGTAVVLHQIPYMVNVGVSRQTAGLTAVAFAVANIAGRLAFGWLGDHLNKTYCFAIAALLKGLGVLGFALATSVGQFVPSLISLGIGFGGVVPLRPALQAERFGLRAFGTVQGFLMVSVTLGTVISPLFAGWMFDAVGSYRPAFLVLALSTLLAIPVILAMPRQARPGFGHS